MYRTMGTVQARSTAAPHQAGDVVRRSPRCRAPSTASGFRRSKPGRASTTPIDATGYRRASPISTRTRRTKRTISEAMRVHPQLRTDDGVHEASHSGCQRHIFPLLPPSSASSTAGICVPDGIVGSARGFSAFGRRQITCAQRHSTHPMRLPGCDRMHLCR